MYMWNKYFNEHKQCTCLYCKKLFYLWLYVYLFKTLYTMVLYLAIVFNQNQQKCSSLIWIYSVLWLVHSSPIHEKCSMKAYIGSYWLSMDQHSTNQLKFLVYYFKCSNTVGFLWPGEEFSSKGFGLFPAYRTHLALVVCIIWWAISY